MAQIDRVIIEVNDKVYSFLNPTFWDETEYYYNVNHPMPVTKLSIIIPYDKNFINDVIDRSCATFRGIKKSTCTLVLQGATLVNVFFMSGLKMNGNFIVINLEAPYIVKKGG